MGWTDERVEQSKVLWTEGLSASQIALVLGGVSRNAVLSKLHRIGFAGTVPHASKPARSQKYASPPPELPKPEPAPPAPAIEAPKQDCSVTIFEAGFLNCRWPLWSLEDHADTRRYCGAMKEQDSPYCRAHEAKAFTKGVSRRDISARSKAQNIERATGLKRTFGG